MTMPPEFIRSRRYSFVISNPPFSRALDLLAALLPLTQHILAFLLPMSWLGSSERAAFLREHPPSLYVLPERPVFRGFGTDQETYAWFVFSRHCRPRSFGDLCILPPTPVEVRRASEAAAAAEMPEEWRREAEAQRERQRLRALERKQKSKPYGYFAETWDE